VQITACIKSTGIEIYRNAFPAGRAFNACFDGSCVNENTGFVLYSASTLPPPPACVPTTEICDGKDNNCNGLIDENNVCAPPPANSWTITTLTRSCTANNVACSVQSDTSTGACRNIIFTTSSGNIQIQGCDKGSGYVEIYSQASPSGLAFSACLANGCVTKDAGFVRFQPSGSSPPPPPPSGGINVATLTVTVMPGGTKTLDTMENSGCRRVTFTPSPGIVDARICPKTDHYEMYLLSSPNSASICVGTNCVGPAGGFKSFT